MGIPFHHGSTCQIGMLFHQDLSRSIRYSFYGLQADRQTKDYRTTDGERMEMV